MLAVAVTGSDIGACIRLSSNVVCPLTYVDHFEDCFADLSGSESSVLIDGGTSDSQASQVLAAVASPKLTGDNLVKHISLDYTSLQGCGSACMEESLKVVCCYLLMCSCLMQMAAGCCMPCCQIC